LENSLGATGPALVGAIMAAVGLIPLLALAGARATSRATGRHTSPVEPGITIKDAGHVSASSV
jgi:DHA1 family inner membrane transport protein